MSVTRTLAMRVWPICWQSLLLSVSCQGRSYAGHVVDDDLVEVAAGAAAGKGPAAKGATGSRHHKEGAEEDEEDDDVEYVHDADSLPDLVSEEEEVRAHRQAGRQQQMGAGRLPDYVSQLSRGKAWRARRCRTCASAGPRLLLRRQRRRAVPKVQPLLFLLTSSHAESTLWMLFR